MKITNSVLVALFLLASHTPCLQASPDIGSALNQQGTPSLRYKVISGYKQPFNDDLQLHLSKGWTPVGGVAVTTWNNDLFYAQLLSQPSPAQ